jgi:ribonuclease Z
MPAAIRTYSLDRNGDGRAVLLLKGFGMFTRRLGGFAVTACAMLWCIPSYCQIMKVTLLGTGTPVLNINRFGISTLVEAGDQKLLFDAGRGAAIRLHQAKVPLRDVSAIFLSLLNSDHLTGLPDIYAMAGLPVEDGRRLVPLEVWGPEGVNNVTTGIEMMLADNNRMRLLQHEMTEQVTHFNTHVVKEGEVYHRDGVSVIAFLLEHGDTKPDYGYKISYKEHSVVITDDTAFHQNIIEYGKGADMIIQSVAIASRALEKADPQYVNHFYSFLANPEVVGRIFAEIMPNFAVLSHISLYSKGGIPRPTEQELSSRIAALYPGPVLIGQDLMQFAVDDDGVKSLPYLPERRNEEPQ